MTSRSLIQCALIFACSIAFAGCKAKHSQQAGSSVMAEEVVAPANVTYQLIAVRGEALNPGPGGDLLSILKRECLIAGNLRLVKAFGNITGTGNEFGACTNDPNADAEDIFVEKSSWSVVWYNIDASRAQALATLRVQCDDGEFVGRVLDMTQYGKSFYREWTVARLCLRR